MTPPGSVAHPYPSPQAHPAPHPGAYPATHAAGHAYVQATASAKPSGFRVNSSVITSAVLALLCLGVAGMFANETLKHHRVIGHKSLELKAAEAELSSMAYGPDGNVAQQDRLRYTDAMREVRAGGRIEQLKQTRITEGGISGAALLGFAIFGVVAVRAGRAR